MWLCVEETRYKRTNMGLKIMEEGEDEKKLQLSMLPADLLQRIADLLLVNLIDYIRFRAVSTSLCSAIIDPQHLRPPLPDQAPWLMYSFDEESDKRFFYRFFDDKVVEFSLPEILGSRIVGAAEGWFILIDLTSGVRLLNPLTRAQIHLPPLITLPDQFIKLTEGEPFADEFTVTAASGDTFTVSAEDVQDFVVEKVVVSDDGTIIANIPWLNRLVFARAGDDKWTGMDMSSIWNDIMPCEGGFYAVNKTAEVIFCDIGPPTVITKVVSTQGDKEAYRWYLVEGMGELLFVARYLSDTPRAYPRIMETKKFKVFKLDRGSKDMKLVEVKSLGDHILFLGGTRSLCLSAKDFPGCYGNHIYFTLSNCEDHHGGFRYGNDFGVFNLENGKVDLRKVGPFSEDGLVVWPPPIWFTPRLC